MPLRVLENQLPLDESIAIRTTDRAEAVKFVEQFFPGIKVSFGQSHGLFEFQLNAGSLGQTQLTAHDQHIAGGATFAYQNEAARLSVEIPIRGMTRVTADGATAEAKADKTLIVTSPEQNLIWDDDGLSYRCLNLHFDMSRVMRCFQLLTGDDDERPFVFDLAADITQPAARQFLQVAIAPFLPREGGRGAFDIPASAALYEEFLIHSMLINLRHSKSGLLETSATTTSSSMLVRCEEYLQEKADTGITISDVAEHLGVSVRSLQRTFQREHGTTPMRRLKQIRLERVRLRLMNADPAEGVTQLAFASGFSHLGAFAADYKKRFGETPSQTLKRAGRQD